MRRIATIALLALNLGASSPAWCSASGGLDLDDAELNAIPAEAPIPDITDLNTTEIKDDPSTEDLALSEPKRPRDPRAENDVPPPDDFAENATESAEAPTVTNPENPSASSSPAPAATSAANVAPAENLSPETPAAEMTDDGASVPSQGGAGPGKSDYAAPQKESTSAEVPDDITRWTRQDMIHYHRDLIHRHHALPEDDEASLWHSSGLNLVTVGSQIYTNPADKTFFPYLHLQQAHGLHFALGLMSTVFTYAKYTDYGGMITASAFIHKAFHGFGATLGIGAGKATNGLDAGLAHSALLTVGGQWFVWGALNLGLQAGVQHFYFYATAASPTTTMMFVPTGQIQIGYAF